MTWQLQAPEHDRPHDSSISLENLLTDSSQTFLFESRTLWQCTFFTVFQHYNSSFVKVNEDVLMATREKILLEEVSTPP